MTRGGARRMVVPWVSLASTPRAARRPQATAAYLAHGLARQRRQPVVQVRAQLGGALLKLAGGQHGDDLAADRAGQWVAAERRAVLAGPVHAEDLAGGHHRRDRHDAT